MPSAPKKIEKKMKILDTAFSLFRNSSVSATAIDDIVKAAGIARGTFYLYFKDKSDLLEEIILYKSTEYMREVLRKTFSEYSREESDIFSFVRSFLNHYIDFLIENREMLPVMSKNLSSCLRNLPEFYDSEIEEIYSQMIKEMEKLGYSEQTAHVTVYLIVDMMGSVCSDAILLGKPFPIEQIRNTVIESALALIKSNAHLERGDLV